MNDRRYLAGLVGRGIGASRSPWMHECEADAQGVRLVYSLFDFSAMGCEERDLPRILEAAQTLGFAGVNVTHPYKQSVIQYLDALSDDAERIGAVNTVSMTKGRSVGHNTDVIGFADSFRRNLIDVNIDHVLLLGAGGAGAATAHALLQLGVRRLAIHDIDIVRARALVENLSQHFDAVRVNASQDADETARSASGLVNATPVGMAAHPGLPISTDSLRQELWVADLVYFPLQTELLRVADGLGCRTLDGGGMAVSQAAAAFEIFTGLKADIGRMQRNFLEQDE